MATERTTTMSQIWSGRLLACFASAMLVFAAAHRSSAAQPDQSAQSLAPTSVETAEGETIDAQITATIDGELILDTRHHGIRVHDDAPDRWQTNLVSSRTSAAATFDDAGRWIVRSGEPFSIRAQRGSDNWEVEGRITALPNAMTNIVATARHDGFVIGSLQYAIPDGGGALLRFVDPDHSERVIALNAVMKRTTEATLSADSAAPATRSAGDGSASEIASYRRMFPPQFPMEAMRDGVNGKVVLRMRIDAHGLPLTAEVQSLVPETATMLADAAIAAALRWRFNPAIKDGQAREGYVLVPVVFSGAVPTRVAVADDEGHVTVQSPQAATQPHIGYRRISALFYPAEAIADRVAGTLFVNATVRPDGSVRDAFVDQAFPMAALALSNVTLAAVKGWQFKQPSGPNDGADRQVIVPIEFRIENDAFAPAGGAKTPFSSPAYPAETPKLAKIIVLGKAL